MVYSNRDDFAAHARKSVDRLVRYVVQTSSALQNSKWLAGAKIVYDGVIAKRTAVGQPSKPFMDWAGLEHDAENFFAGNHGDNSNNDTVDWLPGVCFK